MKRGMNTTPQATWFCVSPDTVEDAVRCVGKGGQRHAGRANAQYEYDVLPDMLMSPDQRERQPQRLPAADVRWTGWYSRAADRQTRRYHYDLTGKLTRVRMRGLSPCLVLR
ncbi:hypothetical protein ACLBOM_19935 [Escherichia coli]